MQHYRPFIKRPIGILLLALFVAGHVQQAPAQVLRHTLFLGNSYTGFNNLPQLVQSLARSAGDSLVIGKRHPGGYTLQDHRNDAQSTQLIQNGTWDYVILQGQSQEPILQTGRFNQAALGLHKLVHQHHPCATTLLYMTWGRKNGDANNCPNFPVMCAYASMDSALQQRYLGMAQAISEEVAPVAVVWRYLRQQHPAIELYQTDESHPSRAGSYAAACTFYTTIFKKDPLLITNRFGLSSSDALAIRQAVKKTVFDSLAQWDFKQKALASFRYQIGSGFNEVLFNGSAPAVQQEYSWDFGDGDSSQQPNPQHSYASDGSYLVRLTTTNCDLQGSYSSTADTLIEFCAHQPTIRPKKPWLCQYDTLWTDSAQRYQWYAQGVALPETAQYLAHYQRYNSAHFMVRTTSNGCTEQSPDFTAVPQSSGYFFDAAFGGDPCMGDTALFIVKHVSGQIPATAQILWYKDGQVLPPPPQVDTLKISAQGRYQAAVIDSAALCPLDTTYSGPVVFDCGSLRVSQHRTAFSWSVFPNPTSGALSLRFDDNQWGTTLKIYDLRGRLVAFLPVQARLRLDVSSWPRGVYILRVSGVPHEPYKLIKR